MNMTDLYYITIRELIGVFESGGIRPNVIIVGTEDMRFLRQQPVKHPISVDGDTLKFDGVPVKQSRRKYYLCAGIEVQG